MKKILVIGTRYSVIKYTMEKLMKEFNLPSSVFRIIDSPIKMKGLVEMPYILCPLTDDATDKEFDFYHYIQQDLKIYRHYKLQEADMKNDPWCIENDFAAQREFSNRCGKALHQSIIFLEKLKQGKVGDEFILASLDKNIIITITEVK